MTEPQLTFETNGSSPYHISLEVFEGPLDLLLHLIKESNIDIFNIPVAQITDQYLSYIDAMQELNLNVAGEFLLMASTLAHLKSKLLLPPDPTQEEDDESGQDPRAELVRRLLEYQKYKQASHDLWALPQLERDTFIRVQTKKIIIQDQPVELAEVSVFKLVQAFHKILDGIPSTLTHNVEKEYFSIRDCALELEHHLKRATDGKIYFSKIFKNETNRSKVVASFLAILAMIKRGVLRVYQTDDFDDILLSTTDAFNEGEWSYDGTEFDDQQPSQLGQPGESEPTGELNGAELNGESVDGESLDRASTDESRE
jgi:segregation and condensation protein A